MTDDVAALVLHNNYRQSQAISLAEFQAVDRSGEYRRFIRHFEDAGKLDRALEFIPSDEELAERRVQGKALTRPELSVLISYSKAVLKEDLIDSNLGEDNYLASAVKSAFPGRLVDEYETEVLEHRLHREIMATQVANDIINRMGFNFVRRQQKATGACVADVARAYTAVMHIYDLAETWSAIESQDHLVSSGVQMEMMLGLISLVKRATRWLLRNRRHQLVPTLMIEEFREGLDQLRTAFPAMLRGRASDQYQSLFDHFVEEGVEEDLAKTVASTNVGYTALGIMQAAGETDAPLLDVASLYFTMGERLELDWFSGQILASKVDNEWQALARDTYLEDLEWQQRTLTVGALRHLCEGETLLTCLQSWEKQEASLLARWQDMLGELHATETPDFGMFAVANRELLDLAQSSTRAAMA